MKDSVDKKELSIFSKSGTQVDKWRQAVIRLDSNTINYDFKIAFDGIAGNNYYKGINNYLFVY